jgi:ribonuclease R
VHRSLIKAYDLGEGELSDVEAAKLDEIAAHISSTERVSAEAERNSVDRFTAAFLKDKLGTEFTGRIGGVTRFGLFVKLDQTAADGLVPIRSLPDDYYMHDEGQHALIGRRTGRVFRLGAAVTVRVVEADTLTGSTVLELVNGEAGADVEGYKGRVYIPEAPGRRGGRNDRGGGSHRKGGGRDSGKRDDRKPRHPEGRNGKGSTRDGGGKSGSSGSRGNAGGGGRGGPSRGGKKGGKPGNPRKNPR